MSVCIHHEKNPAIARCTECGGDICGLCHGSDLRGRAVCSSCRAEKTPFGAIAWEHDPGPSLTGFVQTLTAVLFAPRSFFLRMSPLSEAWAPAAAFGVLCIAFGTVLQTLWQRTFSTEYTEAIARYTEELGTSTTMAEFAIFASIPFGAVVLYFLHTAMLYFALKIFGVSDGSWSLVARITGYSFAAYAMFIFPPLGSFSLGHFLMVLWLFNLEVSAVRWFFRLGFWQSMGVVLLPLMLFLFVIS